MRPGALVIPPEDQAMFLIARWRRWCTYRRLYRQQLRMDEAAGWGGYSLARFSDAQATARRIAGYPD